MRLKLFCIFNFLFFAFRVYASDYLIVVDNLTEQSKKDFFVIDYVRNHFIAIANKDDLAQMNTRNFSYQILDTDPKTKEYYLVYPLLESNETIIDESIAKPFEKYGKVIKIFEKCLLMQANIGNLEKITEYQIKKDYLEMDKISFDSKIDPEAMAIHKRPVIANQYITDMLKHFEKESKDSADKIMRECVAFQNRYVGGKYMKEQVNPWIKARFKAYRCDSIFELPIKGYDAPCVAGVRYGKKNKGLLNGFVSIMGGHTDNWVSGMNGETRFQGAWDGGSQTVGFMEACRLLQYYDFENTIVFSNFSGEEKGFLGATALLQAFKTAGVKTICGWNYDMIGWSGSVRMSTGTATGSTEQADKVKSLYTTYNLSKYVKMSHYRESPSSAKEEWQERSTDLTAYNKIGYLATQFMGGGGGSIHTAADTINANYTGEKMAASCLIGAVTLMEYAVPVGSTDVKPNNAVSYINNHNLNLQNTQGVLSVRYSNKNQIPLSLTIYNSLGRTVATIAPEKISQDLYSFNWNYGTIAEGTYIVNCKTIHSTISEKIMILK